MPLVLVHGVPETAAIWDPLRAALGRDDVIALSPPGFGAPVPEGFGATADEYRQWLIDAVEQIDGPVDLVGHDWGGAHVVRLASARPDLVRSWAIDGAGLLDPEYVWHDLAQLWQRPGEGEALAESMYTGPVEERAAALVKIGMTPEVARACAAAGPAMAGCVPALYRSALQPIPTGWGRELEAAERRPGLAIIATADPYTGGETLARRSAARFGAQEAVLEGLGHWWMLQDPAAGAAALRAFLSALS
jgi:pimeloyl-ACP methyl ester carboxylesterase